MLEASVNKDDLVVARKRQVRLSRQVLAVESESESKAMRGATNYALWESVP